MEHLAWQLLEEKCDVVGAERIFCQLINRKKIISSSKTTNTSSNNNEAISNVQKMCAAVIDVHNNSSSSSSNASTTTTTSHHHLAAAVCHPRFPSSVIFGSPSTEEQLGKANHRILLVIHPDRNQARADAAHAACIRLGQRKDECLVEVQKKIEQEEGKRRIAEEERMAAAEKARADKEAEEVMNQFAASINQHDSSSSSTMLNNPLSPDDRSLDASVGSLNNNTTTSNDGGQSFYDATNSANHQHVAAYHLPPLQPRYLRTTHNNNNTMNGSRSNMNSNTKSSTKSGDGSSSPCSSSFASPTQKPLPPQLSNPSCGSPHRPTRPSSGIPSSPTKPAKNNTTTTTTTNSNNIVTTPRNQTADQRLTSMMSDLKSKVGGGVKLTSCSDYFREKRAEDAQKRHLELKQQQFLEGTWQPSEDDDPDLVDEFFKAYEDGVSRQVEDRLREMMSSLKEKNSNVQINFDVQSTSTSTTNAAPASPPGSACGSSRGDASSSTSSTRSSNRFINSNGVAVAGRAAATPQKPASARTRQQQQQQQQQQQPKSCVDFVKQRLGEVLSGHLESFGDAVIDPNTIAEAVGAAALSGASQQQQRLFPSPPNQKLHQKIQEKKHFQQVSEKAKAIIGSGGGAGTNALKRRR